MLLHQRKGGHHEPLTPTPTSTHPHALPRKTLDILLRLPFSFKENKIKKNRFVTLFTMSIKSYHLDFKDKNKRSRRTHEPASD